MRPHAYFKTEEQTNISVLSYYLKPLSHKTPSEFLIAKHCLPSTIPHPVNPIKHHTLSDIPIHQMRSAVKKEMSWDASSPCFRP